MASFWGDPGTTQIIQTPGTAAAKPPGFQFAQWLFKQLPALMNTPFPTYGGSLDPGLSPTMQDTIRRAQGYAQSSQPEILAGVRGSLGRFMSPSFVNPWNTLWRGGAPNAGIEPAGGGAGGAWGSSPPGGAPGAPMVPRPISPGNSNPWNVAPELFGGANNYYGANPNQTVWGGGAAGDLTYYGGSPGGAGDGGMPTGMVPTPQQIQLPRPRGISTGVMG